MGPAAPAARRKWWLICLRVLPDEDVLLALRGVLPEEPSHCRLTCGGDLSETDVRDAFLDCSEGGCLAFRRRQTLYGL